MMKSQAELYLKKKYHHPSVSFYKLVDFIAIIRSRARAPHFLSHLFDSKIKNTNWIL